MDFAGTGGMMQCIEVHYDRKSETRVPSHVYIHAQVVVVLVVLRTTTLARAQHFSTPPARRGALARGGRGLSPWEKRQTTFFWRRATPGIATLFFATGRLQVSVHMGAALGHLDHISHALDSGTRKEICLFLV